MAELRRDQDPLEQFLVLSKSNKGAGLVHVIGEVLKHPKIFVFDRLLNRANIQKLAGTEYAKSLELLKLFATGTIDDYDETKYPKLTDPQLKKLKLLSLATYASRSKVLTYADLQKQLKIETVRELEDVILAAVYEGLITGRMDQRAGRLEVEHSVGRDIGDQALDEMILKIDTWLGHASTMVQVLEKQTQKADSTLAERQTRERFLAEHINSEKQRIKLQMEQEEDAAALALQRGMMGRLGGMMMGGRF